MYPIMVVLWSQHLQHMASQCRVLINHRITVPLWYFGQSMLFRAFHCVTLATMFVKKYVLASYVGQYVLQTGSTYYERYRRWRWGVRQEPVDRDLWTCKVCIEPPAYNEIHIPPVYDLWNMLRDSPHSSLWGQLLRYPSRCFGSSFQSEYKLTLKESYMSVMPPPSPKYVVDSLVITKYRGKYQVTPDREPDRVQECVRDQAAQLIPSDVRFLCIQYLHPQMKGSPIELTIPPGMMMVGNQLLTPAFVLRLLDHTVGTRSGYPFDLNYTLSVMDSHIRMFNLNSTEFVVLDETTYTIVSQPKPTIDPSMADIEDENGESIASGVSEIDTK